MSLSGLSPVPAGEGGRGRALAASVAILLAVAAADQFTKAWVSRAFGLYEIRPVIDGFFNLTYITNTGAAFGLFARAGGRARAVGLSLVAVAALAGLGFAWARLWMRQRLYPVAIGMIAGGAVGNLIDRVRFGAVVDFLDFYVGRYHWPAFNLADSAITVGVFLFITAGFLEERPRKGDRA